MLGENHWNYAGGRSINKGYVCVLDHSVRTAGKKYPYVYEHVQVMERALGRRLQPDERVRHLDGNKQHNQVSNLEVFRLRRRPGGLTTR